MASHHSRTHWNMILPQIFGQARRSPHLVIRGMPWHPTTTKCTPFPISKNWLNTILSKTAGTFVLRHRLAGSGLVSLQLEGSSIPSVEERARPLRAPWKNTTLKHRTGNREPLLLPRAFPLLLEKQGESCMLLADHRTPARASQYPLPRWKRARFLLLGQSSKYLREMLLQRAMVRSLSAGILLPVQHPTISIWLRTSIWTAAIMQVFPMEQNLLV